MKEAEPDNHPDDALFSSYAQLTENLCERVTGTCLLNGNLTVRGSRGQLNAQAVAPWLKSLGWDTKAVRSVAISKPADGQWLIAIPVQQKDGELIGVLCVQQLAQSRSEEPVARTRALVDRLKPVLDSLHRELAAAAPRRAKTQTLTERTAELEWLFEVTSSARASSNDQKVLDRILNAAADRIEATLAILVIPDKRLRLECRRGTGDASALQRIAGQMEQHLLTWAIRQQRPLLVNGAAAAKTSANCKLLSVPLMRETGRVIGAMAFFNAPQAADFAPRHVFLARHLGRQMTSLIDSQFDLMTGLYTRDGLDQMFQRQSEQNDASGSVLYIDVNHMHVVNELHGFELGNELIVRVAQLLAPPLMPPAALAARITGDRFAVVLPQIDSKAACAVAQQLQCAAGALKIGPTKEQVDVSISCGIAALVNMPKAWLVRWLRQSWPARARRSTAATGSKSMRARTTA